MTTKKSRVEQLIDDSKTIQHEALKNAVERHAEEEQKKQEEELLSQYRQASSYLNDKVDALRSVREREKKIVKQVQIIDKALEQFKIDGDYFKFRSSVQNIY